MVTTSPDIAQIESITKEGLIQSILREGFGMYGTVTATGSTSIITDTDRLKSTQYNDQEWVGGWARISSNADSAGAAPEAEYRPITTYVPSTGIITVNPAFTTAPTTNDRYELWKFPNPQITLDIIDEVMQELIWLPSWTMLSEIPDGDMEQTTKVDWTDSGATSTKVISEPAMNGARWLEVVNGSANDYTRSAVINVEPGQVCYTGALVLPIGNKTGSLIAHDETNNAAIANVIHDGQYMAGIGFDFTVPSNCEQISIRLSGVESDATVRWDEIVFWAYNTPDIALPWWVKNKSQVKALFRYERWQAASLSRFPRQVRGIDSTYGFMDDAFGRGQLRVFRQSGQLNLPLQLYGTRNPIAFTNDTADNRRIDKMYLKAAVLWQLFNHLSNGPVNALFETSWLNDSRDRWENEYNIQTYQQMERIEQTLQGQTQYRQY